MLISEITQIAARDINVVNSHKRFVAA